MSTIELAVFIGIAIAILVAVFIVVASLISTFRSTPRARHPTVTDRSSQAAVQQFPAASNASSQPDYKATNGVLVPAWRAITAKPAAE
jgi:hypothetical protein